ncbi:hypothetical protein GGR56DRAFT_661 [Xylariaceae sp. FL0804]|nr:hypothetical protein GGR56DRAFT_661 [Xylariaceae sp. FL0804]
MTLSAVKLCIILLSGAAISTKQQQAHMVFLMGCLQNSAAGNRAEELRSPCCRQPDIMISEFLVYFDIGQPDGLDAVSTWIITASPESRAPPEPNSSAARTSSASASTGSSTPRSARARRCCCHPPRRPPPSPHPPPPHRRSRPTPGSSST